MWINQFSSKKYTIHLRLTICVNNMHNCSFHIHRNLGQTIKGLYHEGSIKFLVNQGFRPLKDKKPKNWQYI